MNRICTASYFSPSSWTFFCAFLLFSDFQSLLSLSIFLHIFKDEVARFRPWARCCRPKRMIKISTNDLQQIQSSNPATTQHSSTPSPATRTLSPPAVTGSSILGLLTQAVPKNGATTSTKPIAIPYPTSISPWPLLSQLHLNSLLLAGRLHASKPSALISLFFREGNCMLKRASSWVMLQPAISTESGLHSGRWEVSSGGTTRIGRRLRSGISRKL